MLEFNHSSHGSTFILCKNLLFFRCHRLIFRRTVQNLWSLRYPLYFYNISNSNSISSLSSKKPPNHCSKAVAPVFIWVNFMVSHIPNREASCEPPCYSQYTSVGAASVSDVVSTTAHKRKHISTSKSLQLTKSKRPESQQSSSNSLQHRHRKIFLDTLPYEFQLIIYRNLLPHKERIEIVPSQFLVFS